MIPLRLSSESHRFQSTVRCYVFVCNIHIVNISRNEPLRNLRFICSSSIGSDSRTLRNHVLPSPFLMHHWIECCVKRQRKGMFSMPSQVCLSATHLLHCALNGSCSKRTRLVLQCVQYEMLGEMKALLRRLLRDFIWECYEFDGRHGKCDNVKGKCVGMKPAWRKNLLKFYLLLEWSGVSATLTYPYKSQLRKKVFWRRKCNTSLISLLAMKILQCFSDGDTISFKLVNILRQQQRKYKKIIKIMKKTTQYFLFK